MAIKWLDGDSARTMTNKFNTVVNELNSLEDNSESLSTETTKALGDLTERLDEHTGEYKNFKDTTDNSISEIEGEMITSEPASSSDNLSPPVGILAEVKIVNKRLVINTDLAIAGTIQLMVQNNRLVFLTTN